MKRPILFLKAKIPGGARGDLFDQSVQVQGYTRGSTYVAPHTATRKVAPEAPPPPATAAPPPARAPSRMTPEQSEAWMKMLAQGSALRRRARELTAQVEGVAGQSLRFTRKEGGSALVGPDLTEKGKFRVTYFAPDMTPTGHFVVNTLHDAILEMLRSGAEPRAAKEAPPAPEAKPAIPRQVEDRVRAALAWLRDRAEAIERTRRHGGPLDELAEAEKSLEHAHARYAIIGKFREAAKAKGMDPDAILESWGGIPDDRLSEAAQIAQMERGNATPAKAAPPALDGKKLRELYREAVHGAGAEPRRTARAQIDAILAATGMSMKDAFDRERLDLSAYFASRPIG